MENSQNEILPEELSEWLQKEKKFLLLDVRDAEAFSKSKIDISDRSLIKNIPYYEMHEKGGREDFKESVSAYIEKNLNRILPRNEPIIVTCYKGKTSAIIVECLRKLQYQAASLQGGMQAWGNRYELHPICESPNLTILQISRPSKGCLSYYIESKGEACIVDPLKNDLFYSELVEQRKSKLKFVFETHCHADHISGGRHLADHLAVPYYLHPYDGIHPIDVLPAAFAYVPNWEGYQFTVGNANIKVISTPGHTLGHVAYLVEDAYLLAGDSIFLNSLARPDLGGHAETWSPLFYRTLNKLLAFPDTVLVLPGHFSSIREMDAEKRFASPLGHLKLENEGLRMAQKSEKEFIAYILSSLPQFPPEYVDIKRVNLGLLVMDPEKESEMDLGKNVCALSKKEK